MVVEDGRGGLTPLICTSGTPRLFYYSKGLNETCPSCDLAARIEEEARRHDPPFFVLVYGGLQYQSLTTEAGFNPKKNLFTLLGDTVAALGSDFVAVGGSEMARLAREARQ